MKREERELELLVEDLKASYTSFRKQKRPNFELGNQWSDKFWLGVAKTVKSLNVSAETYVKAVFELYDNGVHAPPPTFLASANVKRYLDSKSNSSSVPSEAQENLNLMFKLFEQHVNSGRPTVTVITDNGLYFNDLFRYIMAIKSDLHKTAEIYKDRAKAFVTKHPEYYTLTKDLLPKDF